MTRTLTLIVALLVLAGCDRPKAGPAKPRPVLTLRVTSFRSQELGPFAGEITARYETEQGFRTAGHMLRRMVDVGSIVRKGEVLAQLDPTQEKLQVIATQADVGNAAAQLADAIVDARRKTELAAREELPRSLADATVAHRNASAARLEATRATLQKAEQVLEYTTLKAEFAGVVTSWTTQAGQQVAAGQAVVTVARPDVLEASFDTPTPVAQDLSTDTTFSVSLQIDPSVTVTGQIREVGAISDAVTRTQRLKLSLDHQPAAFRLGTIVTIAVRRQVTLRVDLPESAILEKTGQPARVWLVSRGNRVKLQPVTILHRALGTVTIESDLPKNALVVIAGVHSLTANQEVRVAQVP